MKNNLKKISDAVLEKALVMVPTLLVFLPTVLLAQPTTGGGGSPSSGLQNPLRFNSLNEFLVGILNIVIIIAVPIIVFFIILAGFKYVTARGNATQVQDATRALTYAVIGGVLIIGAVAIAGIIRNLVDSFQAS